MTEVRFYHLLKTPQDVALPQIALKAWQAGGRVVVKCVDDAQADLLNDALWNFRPDSFLPHGTSDDGNAALQPVWLTANDENPNGAKTLIVATGCTSEMLGTYDLCCLFLDGHNDAEIADARIRWKTYKEAGHTVSYWQQGEQGWEKKA